MAETAGSERPRARWWKDGLVVVAVLFGVRMCQAPQVDATVLPPLSGVDLNGVPVTLEPGSEPVLVYFWASWCGSCKATAGSVGELAREARVITVATRSGSNADVQTYLRERHVQFPVINDPDGRLAARFGVRALPTSFIVAPDGTLTTAEVGYTTGLGLKARMWWASL